MTIEERKFRQLLGQAKNGDLKALIECRKRFESINYGIGVVFADWRDGGVNRKGRTIYGWEGFVRLVRLKD